MKPSDQWHRLSDVDVDSQRGTCSICGPTRIRIRSGNRGNECWTQATQNRGRPDRPSRRKPGWRRGTPVPPSPVTTEIRRHRRYRLSVEQHAAMLAAQSGACAICRCAGVDLHVDHDHSCCPSGSSCGQCVRGLLCRRCNVGIGVFLDNVENLRAAIDYLQRQAS